MKNADAILFLIFQQNSFLRYAFNEYYSCILLFIGCKLSKFHILGYEIKPDLLAKF